MKRWNKIGADIAVSAGRPASNEELHRIFLETNGLTEWAFVQAGFDDIPYILKRGRFPGGQRTYGEKSLAPPRIDHARYYRGHGPALLVYHPYVEPDALCPEVETWAQGRGLRGRVYGADKSWYYPGKTCLVVIAPEEMEVAVP